MDDQNKNLILATALSFIVILVWFVLFPPPEVDPGPQTAEGTGQIAADGTTVPAAPATQEAAAPQVGSEPQSRAEALANAPRVTIETPRLSGSISLLGGRIDDLKLNDYRTTLEADAEIVTMLSPEGSPDAYYALHGWAPGAGVDPSSVPTVDTVWSLTSGDALTPGSPITLSWDNGVGQVFAREIAVDKDYMFTITQSVTNNGDASVAMAPYGMIAQHGEPQDLKNFFILHEGAVSMSNGELTETDWDEMPDAEVNPKWGRPAIVTEDTSNGWIGFTDHYWQAVLAPAADQVLTKR